MTLMMNNHKNKNPLLEAILSNACFIPLTVILEFEWVMRGFYKLSKSQIAQIFKILFAYSHIYIEDKNAVIKAVELCEQGMDFADALHLCHTPNYQGIITFDNKFYKKATQFGFNIELATNFNA